MRYYKTMKAHIQRVSQASVTVDGTTIASIGRGLLVFLGVGPHDTEKNVIQLTEKITALRIFEDAEGKLNLSVSDTKGAILLVSQFTLYADCSKGNRPSFLAAAPPETAKKYYELFIAELTKKGIPVQSGRFGAHMQVELINDGPATFLLEND